MHGSPPNLESFERVLDDLARDPRIAPHSPDWIRDSISAGGEKVHILQYILKAHPPGGSPPRVLDVGANIGSFALLAAKHGCRVSALDYASYADIYAKITAERGVEYRACDLATDPLPYGDNSFDFVTYTDVIEHHAFSPRPVLREIHRVLVPGGRVIILTPNQASIYNRLMLLFGRSIYGDFDHFFDTGADGSIYLGHHHEFTRAELRAALERTGFNVRELRVVEGDLASLLYFRRHRPEHAGASLRRFFIVFALGPVWSAFYLPFGRVLWAVGEKLRIQNS
jgi:SAM-dependent methyltransferase